MKTFLATTAIASVMALPLAAQTVTVDTPSVGAEVGADVSAGADATLKTAQAGADASAGASMSAGDEVGAEFGLAGDIIGQRVYDANDEWIGEVSDVVEAEGTTWLIVDVGGFLGIGEKPVALDLAEFEITQDTENAEDPKIIVSVDLTQEELEAMPTYDLALGTEAEAGAEAESEIAADSGLAPDAGAEGDAEAEASTDMAAGTELAPEADAEAEAGTDMAAGTDLTPGAEATLEAETDVAAEITGKRVYDANDEWIGEISEVVVADDGRSWAIIDVGGFLGIGEKPVAMDISELEIVTEGEGDGFTTVKISVPKTKEELEAMPTYEKM